MKPLIALALVFIALPTFSQQNFSMSGSACHAITPAQADQLEWRTTGIKKHVSWFRLLGPMPGAQIWRC